jgi:hypothetical protein
MRRFEGGHAICVGAGRRGWLGCKESIAVGLLLVRRLRHAAVLEIPSESRALAGLFPIPRGFRNEQMEQRVVAGRNCAPQARLSRSFPLPAGKLVCLLQKVIGERHWGASCPSGIFDAGNLRLAAEVEIGVHAVLVGLELIH